MIIIITSMYIIIKIVIITVSFLLLCNSLFVSVKVSYLLFLRKMISNNSSYNRKNYSDCDQFFAKVDLISAKML